jgi:hypothetical protein
MGNVKVTEAYWGQIFLSIFQNVNFNLGNANLIFGYRNQIGLTQIKVGITKNNVGITKIKN